jgi:hypothetical protein
MKQLIRNFMSVFYGDFLLMAYMPMLNKKKLLDCESVYENTTFQEQKVPDGITLPMTG